MKNLFCLLQPITVAHACYYRVALKNLVPTFRFHLSLNGC